MRMAVSTPPSATNRRTFSGPSPTSATSRSPARRLARGSVPGFLKAVAMDHGGAAVTQITQRLWGDLSVGDLATTGRVLSTVLARANAELASA